MEIQKNASDAAGTLDEILMPDKNGIVRFGAAKEPLHLSQVEAARAVQDALRGGETTMNIVQPGGTGKTREAILIAYAMHQHGRKSLFVVPSQQAVEDFSRKAKTLCPDLDVGAVYQGEKRLGNLTFITYASLLRRTLGLEEAAAELRELGISEEKSSLPANKVKINPREYDLLLWDEAHNYLKPNAVKLKGRFPL